MTMLTDSLWEKYQQQRDDGTRSQLIAQYLGLVHHSAHELAKHVPKDLELDDLISAGTVGLVQALECFDPGRGLAFSTYAVPRIRGAMLDELRTWDWVPRSVRERSRRIEDANRQIQRRLGRMPEASEMAEALGVDEATYRKWMEESGAPVLMPLDSAARGQGGREVPLSELIPDPGNAHPSEILIREETMNQLRDAFSELPAKERLVLSLYYYQELTLKQIGQVLHITESRVSQLHARAIRRMRERFRQIGGEP